MKKLRLTGFGIRGFIGESLPPAVVIDFASAFGSYLDGQPVLLGRDTRDSSPMVHACALSGLLSTGCEVLDFGVCPTPLLQHAVPRYQAGGAVSVSGGHTAQGWNAVTLIGSRGAILEPGSGDMVLDVFHARDFSKKDFRHLGKHRTIDGYSQPYFDALAREINVEAIRKANLTVIIDPVGGAGCAFLQSFAHLLGVRLVPLNAEPSGYLAREPEPRPRSARQMAAIIRPIGADAGFVLSSDMGRLSIVTETGEPASEEYTLALIARHVLSRRPGPLVTNICTTRIVDDIAARHGVGVLHTKVGQSNVMAAALDADAVLAGEGSGSAALPSFSPAFDGFMMMALLLESMAQTGRTLSDLLRDLPRYHMVKRTHACSSREGYRAMETLKSHDDFIQGGRIDQTDGFRVDWPDSWLHIRASRTQQMVRVIAEAADPEVAERRADEAMRILLQSL